MPNRILHVYLFKGNNKNTYIHTYIHTYIYIYIYITNWCETNHIREI